MIAKHLRFCEEYVVDLNATQAYIRAGYAKKAAGICAAQLLKKPIIQSKIAELQESLRQKTGVTAEMVVAELAKIGFSNFRDFVNRSNKPRMVHDLTEEQSAVIEGITITEIQNDYGTKTQTKLKLSSKVEALEKLGRHLGIFEKDNEQKTGPIIVEITD